MRILYNIMLFFAAIPGLLYFLLKMLITGKYRKSFIQKLGGRQKETLARLKKGRRVWIHAVSVGEVTAAAPVVQSLKALRPDVQVILSTSTETGQAMARKLVDGADAFIYFPLDFPWTVRKMIRLAEPSVFVLVETELWPNFLAACRRSGISSLIVNGRISPRSFSKYRKTDFFWRSVLKNVAAAGMISEVDASRIAKIGMDAGKIKIMGNAKYDALAAMASPVLHDEIARRFNVQKNEAFLVAGSTHAGEEDMILEAYRKLLEHHPDFGLILVPRHVDRAPDVINLLKQEGFHDMITATEINGGRLSRGEKIIVVDVIGELFKVYSLGAIVYCGGSLVPKGGQNILEAAAWGKIIFYGPSMDDFSQEAALLEDAGAGIRVHDVRELSEKMLQALADAQGSDERGRRGQAVVFANRGAAGRYAELIISYIDAALPPGTRERRTSKHT